MTTFSMVIDGLVASREWDASTLTRLSYWNTIFGDLDISEITPDEVDDALTALAQRGKMKPIRGAVYRPTGKPLAQPSYLGYM